MDSLISLVQLAFINGRNLVDGVLVLNEVVDLVKKNRKQCMIFKVDFEKAYDFVRWSFLDYMMQHVGLNNRWRAWIKVCVFCGNIYVYRTMEAR